MNKTRIDWGIPNLYTWNPVVGCKRGCEYCYAKKLNDRFKWVEDFSHLKFFKDRLEEPLKVSKPRTIFVGSMSDVCYWEWYVIASVIEICRLSQRHTFMFLTKNPSIYKKFYWPANTMLGLTVTGDGAGDKIQSFVDNSYTRQVLYLSIEPLLGSIGQVPLAIDRVIVGAMTGPGATKPKKGWIDSIEHPNIYWKPSIRPYL